MYLARACAIEALHPPGDEVGGHDLLGVVLGVEVFGEPDAPALQGTLPGLRQAAERSKMPWMRVNAREGRG